MLSKTLKYTVTLFALLLISILLGFSNTSSQAQENPQFDFFTATSNRQTLRAMAKANGRVPVIVGLATADMSAMSGEARVPSIRSAQANLMASLAGQKIRRVTSFEFVPYMAMTVDLKALRKLQKSPLVTSVTLDAISAPTLEGTTTQIGAAGSNGAWAAGYQGAGQTVAILDSGVDKNHSALAGRVVSEACYGSSGRGSGYKAVPWCPGGAQSSTAVNSGLNCNLAYVGCDHGTHVAGIVASNDASRRGVAPQANLIAVQVFSKFDGRLCTSYYGVSTCTLSFTSDQIDGLNRVYALRNTYNIASVNMSLGGGQYTTQSQCDSENSAIKSTIDLLRGAGIAVVIASGNDGFTNSLGAPGCISSAVSVGAVDNSDKVASFSNSASFLDLLAPGVAINSSVPGGAFESWNGTSMATPHVAGAWALLKQARPALSVTQAENAFKVGGVLVTDTRNGVTTPRIHVMNAINAAP